MPSNPKWLPRAKRMLMDGMSRNKIAAELGISPARLSAVLIEHKLGAGPDGKPRPNRRPVCVVDDVEAEPEPVASVPWPRGRFPLGADPFANLTQRERDVIARAAPEAAMWAIMQARGLA